MDDDPYALRRFLDAQAPVYDQVCRELSAGRKTSHWMWFVFPQIAGLGLSAMSARYAITGRAEALAYLAHPTLGARLRHCTALVLGVEGGSASRLFGSPDDAKFRSCMTLFSRVSGEALFEAALQRFYGGVHDEATLRLLGADDLPAHRRTSDK